VGSARLSWLCGSAIVRSSSRMSCRLAGEAVATLCKWMKPHYAQDRGGGTRSWTTESGRLCRFVTADHPKTICTFTMAGMDLGRR
jgi:hypothetical protein